MARVLLSESDPDVRRLLRLLLERLGHEVVALEEEEDADDGCVDLMLLEPASLLGLERAFELRAEAPLLPILCVSILPEEARVLELGPLAYLTKPFALDDLRRAVDGALALPARAA